ncbi:MAG: amylosucrase [Clostridia bacterium]|nr:amylosucrase [Clostridia bacterium]
MIHTQWKPEFESRLRRHQDELKQLHFELYHSNLKAFDAYVEMLYHAWQDRPEALRLLDRARQDDPQWLQDRARVAMPVDVAAFAGTIKGLQARLDYLADCGVRMLHLTNLLRGPRDMEHGAAVSDFRAVQPEIGALEDLSRLAEQCRKRGIALCTDLSMHHTSDQHEWARRARAGEKACQDRYYFYDSYELPNAYEQTMPQELPLASPGNFSWCEEAQKVVMTTFYPDQWDLNYMNPAVLCDMTENLLFLCNQGIDAIRLEGLPYLWKALGTSCRHLRQVHSLARILRMACEIVCPGVLLLGDVALEPGPASAYFGSEERPECHLLYNTALMAAVWHTVATRDVRLLAHQVQQMLYLPKRFTFLNYLRSRDPVVWNLDFGFLGQFGTQESAHKRYLNDYLSGKWPGSTARGELYHADPRLGDAQLFGTTASLCGIEAAREKNDGVALARAIRTDIMLHAFLFTLSGVPVLCSGDEIARENDPPKTKGTRRMSQGPMDWHKAALRADPITAEGQVFAAIRRLEALRAEHPALDDQADVRLLNTGSDQVLGISRSWRGEKLLALFNFSPDTQIAWLKDLSLYTDLHTTASIDAGAVTVPAGGYRWLIHTEEAR